MNPEATAREIEKPCAVRNYASGFSEVIDSRSGEAVYSKWRHEGGVSRVCDVLNAALSQSAARAEQGGER